MEEKRYVHDNRLQRSCSSMALLARRVQHTRLHARLHCTAGTGGVRTSTPPHLTTGRRTRRRCATAGRGIAPTQSWWYRRGAQEQEQVHCLQVVTDVR